MHDEVSLAAPAYLAFFRRPRGFRGRGEGREGKKVHKGRIKNALRGNDAIAGCRLYLFFPYYNSFQSGLVGAKGRYSSI